MMDFFQKYEVEFVSSTEKFDTSTPMGRAMLNIWDVYKRQGNTDDEHCEWWKTEYRKDYLTP